MVKVVGCIAAKNMGCRSNQPLAPIADQQDNVGEEWGLLKVPGKNSLLSVVMGILAWGKACMQMNEMNMTEQWKSAVEDCTFMIDGLCEHGSSED